MIFGIGIPRCPTCGGPAFANTRPTAVCRDCGAGFANGPQPAAPRTRAEAILQAKPPRRRWWMAVLEFLAEIEW